MFSLIYLHILNSSNHSNHTVPPEVIQVGYEFHIILNVVDITSPSLQHNSLYSPYIFAPCHAKEGLNVEA